MDGLMVADARCWTCGGVKIPNGTTRGEPFCRCRKSDNVVPLAPHLVEVGEGYRFDADEILEQAKGQGFTALVVMAECPDGSIWVSSSANTGAALILMEKAKRQIVFGEET